jgi:restriction system protein
MAVPVFYQFHRPILKLLEDQQPRHWQEIEPAVADHLMLSVQDREEMLPSNQRTRLADRVKWALTYLRQARLVETVGRGSARITPRGLEFVRRAPHVIKPADLMAFPEFAEFQKRSRPQSASSTSTAGTSELEVGEEVVTPGEALEAAHQQLNARLEADLLDRIKGATPDFFEGLIVKLMLKLGYGRTDEASGRVLGKSGDGGVDGVISQDKLGLDKIYLQAKRWSDSPVGVKEIQAFVGALGGQGASKGVFITTSSFSKQASEYATRVAGQVKISLVDGQQLARLMVQHDLGVALERRYDVKRVDTDFFLEN